jgi:hypothetical protein
MADVSSLWVGSPLSLAHKIALSSFVYYGHNIKLYVYDMTLDVPPGVIKADANEIIPESEIFYHYGKLAAFADYFRYAMITRTGDMWVDADTICLSEYFFEDKEYVFIEELPGVYAQGILKMPQTSLLCNFMHKKSSRLRFENKPPDAKRRVKDWSFLGPTLLTKAVKGYSLQSHAQPSIRVNGLELGKDSPYDLFWNPDSCGIMLDRVPGTVCMTFFNSIIDLSKMSHVKNILPEGSFIWELGKKFLGESFITDASQETD